MAQVTRRNFAVNRDGFSYPAMGGDVSVRYATLTFEDTAEKELFVVPAGTVFTGYEIIVTEDFDAGDANDVDLGIAGNEDGFAADADVSAAGVIRPGDTGAETGLLFGDPLEVDTPVVGVFIPDGTAATEGALTFAVYFIRMRF